MLDQANDYVDVVHRTWQHAASRPDAPAVRQGEQVWTYGDLVRSASRHARRFTGNGLSPGDRVLLVAPSTVGFVQAYLGILAAGAVAVTVNPLCTARELQYFAEDAGCTLAVGWHENAAMVSGVADGLAMSFIELHDIDPLVDDEIVPLVERGPDDPAVLLYTSGTTGRPKGAIVTLGNIFASTLAVRLAFDFSDDDRMGTALPLFHVFGQVAVLAGALDVGASVSLLRPFSAEGLLRMVERDEVTVLCGVPTMWIGMLESARSMDPAPNITSLRIAASGGAALPLEVSREFAAEFGAEVLDGYGLSETTSAASSRPPSLEPREGSVGRALPGIEIRIVDADGQALPAGEVGEITVAGKNVTQGYWGRPDETAEVFIGDRLLTGDLGRLDEDGYLWVVGRKKEVIIRGGYNVYPREVEDAIYEHPAVMEAAVLGVPDERLGEEVAAVVVFRDGMSAAPEELRAWLDQRVAAYKVPRVFQFVSALPKGATGKVHKLAIDREQVRTRGVHTRRSIR